MSTTKSTKKFTKELIDINTNANLIDGVCLLACNVSGSCGESTIPKEMVTVRGNSASNALKGTKIEWFPKEALKFVNAASTSTKAILNRYGVRYGDMTLVPIDGLDDCLAELNDAGESFKDKLNIAVSNFDSHIANHKLANPDISDLIDDFKMSADTFESRFKFRTLTPLAMKPLFEDDEEALAADIADTLYDEIAAMANKVYYKSIYDKDKNAVKSKVSCKVRSSMMGIYNKLASLAFVDKGIIKLLEDFKAMLKKLPKEGGIEGADLMALNMFTLLLGDANKIKLHGQGHNQLIDAFVEEEDVDELEEQQTACLFDFDASDVVVSVLADQSTNQVADASASMSFADW